MRSRSHRLVSSAVIQGVGMAVAAAGTAIAEALLDLDGRSFASHSTRRFAIRESQLETADANPAFNNGWFVDQFRCSRSSFDLICDLVEEHWLKVNDPINHNAVFFARERVAVTLYYLVHSGNLVSSAKTFGMSKSSADRYIWQIIDVIGIASEPIYVKLPGTDAECKKPVMDLRMFAAIPTGVWPSMDLYLR